MKLRKTALNVLTIVFLTSVISGCTNPVATTKVNIQKTTPDSYPIKTDVELKYYAPLYHGLTSVAASLNETRFAEQLIKETGINVTFMHPTPGQESEGFNLMIASNDLPDIIESVWYTYPGGPTRAINEQTIIPLNGIIEKVSPNIKKFYEQNSEASKMMKTDDGDYYMYPFVRGDDILATFLGPMVRKDLLDKSGLEKPETIEEWDIMLRKFKEMGVKIPITLALDNSSLDYRVNFIGAFGILPSFYHENDTVKYGPYEKAYGDYVALLNRWYEYGILDSDFTNTDSKRITSIVANGDVGAAFGTAGGEFGSWITALRERIPEAEFTPVKYPTMNKGERPRYGQKDLMVLDVGAAISGQCENVEIAARLLDYGYSEEGQMLYNFGIKGLSYNIIEDIPTYTSQVTDREHNGGFSLAQAMSKYIRGHYTGPFIQNKNYILQFYVHDEQKEALGLWSDTDARKYKMPYVYLTSEESREFSRIMQDIDTFRQEELFKYITGRESIERFSNFQNELYNMGIERAIQIQQTAYNRYLSR